MNNNEKFWSTVKPLFFNNIKSAENIMLHENDKLVRKEKEMTNIFKIVPNLDKVRYT